MKNITISLGFLVFLVVAYLGYDLLKNTSNPCGQLFEQTSLKLNTTLAILEQNTALEIGRNRIQELSSSSQLVALSLQSCCIASQTDKISSQQFLQCQTGTNNYANRLDKIAARLAELEKAESTVIAMADDPDKRHNRSLSSRKSSAKSERNKKIQLDKLIDQALDASVFFQKTVKQVTK